MSTVRDHASVGHLLARAVVTVLRAPVLLASVALVQWFSAHAIAVPVRAAVAAATTGHAPGTRPESHERTLALIVELFTDEPSVATTMAASLIAIALTGAIVWTLLSGLVIARLALNEGRADRAELGAVWLRTLPAVLVQTLWHYGLRAGALFAALSLAQSLPGGIGVAVIGITFVIGIVALDLARSGVVVGGASPLHPRTAARACIVALRTPALTIPAALLAALGLALSACTVMTALWALTDGSWLWAARGLSVAGLAVGLSRVAYVARHPALAQLQVATGASAEAEEDPQPGAADEAS